MEPGPSPFSGPAAPAEPASPSGPPPTGSAPPRGVVAAVAVIAVVVAVAAGAVWIVPALTGGSSAPVPSSAPTTSDAGRVPSPEVSPVASVPASLSPTALPSRPLPTLLPGGPFASTGSMVVIGTDESLSLVEASGRRVVLEPPSDASFLFPTWSPDGTRIAVVRSGPAASEILVVDAPQAATAQPAEPRVVLSSQTIGPFYLSWTPDGTSVSYLADNPTGLSLRVVPADGSAPIDGSGPGSTIRSGNPFYFDWIAKDRLLAHIGTGTSAFLGEIGLDGSAETALDSPGDFRSASVSLDGAFVSYVRAAGASGSSIVLAKRDGSGEHTLPVFGIAAVTFAPVGDTLATIGPVAPSATPYSVPLGPLRLIDATSGAARTLLDGNVLAFWWSPDGKTIAALRVQPVAGVTTPRSPAPSVGAEPAASSSEAPRPVASPEARPSEVRLLFVDVASGTVRSEPLVNPGQLFVDQLLTYFDQYALSHRLWAPDSSSLLMPLVGADGATRLAVISANGDPLRTLDGIAGFWSP